jgi:hypothetical protein
MAIFAIDFDGTIVDHEYPDIGNEKPDAFNVMRELQKVGHKIIIWTCRSGKHLEEMNQYFVTRGFKPDAVNANINNSGFDEPAFPKVYADIYIDDRNFPPFVGWESVRKQFLNDVYLDDNEKVLSALEIANKKWG